MMQSTLPHRFQTIVVVTAITLAYVLLHLSFTKTYALQIFLLCITAFFILKRIKRAKLWHVLPSRASVELGLISFAFVFLIGATGNTHSLFYALSYIHLFFLIFSATPTTAVASIIGLIMFHFALEPNLGTAEFGSIISIPVIGALLLFAKRQYDEAHSTEELLEKEVAELTTTSNKEQTLENFIDNFLAPKLDLLRQLLTDPNESKETASKQLSLLDAEVNKIMGRVNSFEPDTKQK